MAAIQERTGPLRGSDGRTLDLSDAGVTKRTSRLPEIALGVLLVAGSALAALAWQTIADPSRTVLAAGRDLSQGQLITLDDLDSIELASDNMINFIDANRSDLVIGGIAQIDLAAGTILTPQMVADVAAIEPGQALVGLTVANGDLPTSTLRVGSVVDMVVTAGQANDESFRNTDDAILVRNATVAEIAGDGDSTVLALAVGEEEAIIVARAAAAERLRMIAVPDDRLSASDSQAADSGNPDGESTIEDGS